MYVAETVLQAWILHMKIVNRSLYISLHKLCIQICHVTYATKIVKRIKWGFKFWPQFMQI
jgi:hypothetical protein